MTQEILFQRLKANQNAVISNLTRKIHRIYSQMIVKPLQNLTNERVPKFIAEKLQTTIMRISKAFDRHLDQLLRLEFFAGYGTEMTRQEARQLLSAFRTQSRYNKALNNFRDDTFKRLMNTDNLKAEAESIGKAGLSRMDRTITTESLAAVNWGREQKYKQWQTIYWFKWSVRKDTRTSPQCLEIDRIVAANGGKMRLQELKRLIRRISLKYDPKLQPRDWVAHYNERSILLRVVL